MYRVCRQLIPFIVSLFLCVDSFAQIKGRVLVQNSPDIVGVVDVKWYSSHIICPQGANLYRKVNNGMWEKVVESPFKINTNLSEASYPSDTTSIVFIEMVKETSFSEIPEIAKINLIVQSFYSNSFSDFLGIYYKDTNLIIGSMVQYKVMEIVGGKERLLGMSDKIKVGYFSPLLPVDSINFSVKRRAVEWKWKPEDDRYFGVVFFRKNPLDAEFKRVTPNPIVVFQNENKGGSDVYPEVMYKEDSLQENVIYEYKAAGIDFFGNYTTFSPVYAVQIIDSTPPPAPQNLVVNSKSVVVDLSWTKPQASDDIDYLRVFRSIKSSGPYLPISEKLTVDVVTFRDTVDKPGPYYYYVASLDLALNQGSSNPAFIEVHDIIPPQKPENIVAVSDTGKVILSWIKGLELDLWGYYVYRTIAGSHEFALLNSAPLKDTSYVDKRPRNAKNTFLYYLVAVDSSYNMSLSSDTVGVKLPDVTPPVPPKISKVFVENGGVSLFWISNVEPDLAGYVVYRGQHPDSISSKINDDFVAPNMVSYTDYCNNKGIVYYKLVAVDSTGNVSFPSEMVSAKVTQPATNVTINLEITKLKRRRGFANFEWNMLPDQMGFVVYRSSDGISYAPISPLITDNFWKETFKRKQKESFFLMVKGYQTSGREIRSNPVKVMLGK